MLRLMWSCVLLAVLSCAAVCGVDGQRTFTGFNFNNYTQAGFGGVEVYVAALVAPLTYAVNSSTTATAAVGTFFLWGGAQISAIVPVTGSSYNPATVLNSGANIGNFGDVGCAQRTGGNRFYTIGTAGSPTFNFTGDLYYNFMSTDGQSWTNILDNATIAAWYGRDNDDNTMCVVDMQNRVYSVGSSDTWLSANLGVTFTRVSPTGPRFSNRTFFAGGIYTSPAGLDTMIVLGGRDAPNAADRYGDQDHNDVWSSNSMGASWSLVTAAAQWLIRDQHSWAISNQGVMVVYGGSRQGGSEAPYGYFSDAWSSVDYGVTWQLLALTTTIGNYSQCAMTFDSAGYLYVFGGQTLGYNWIDISVRSTISLNAVVSSSSSSGSNGPTSAALPRSCSSVFVSVLVMAATLLLLLLPSAPVNRL